MRSVNCKNIIEIFGLLGGITGTVYIIKKKVEKFNKCDRHEFEKGKANGEGYDGQGYAEEGGDRQSISVDEYNREGRDKNGYDREGYDIEGFDRRGYDREGYDIEGFDCRGYDQEGYRRNGFSIDGYNREGLDWRGYARNGYNQLGLDRADQDRQFYAGFLKKLRHRLDEAYQQSQQGQFRYALYDARVVMEETLKMVVQHTNGADGIGDSILGNMKICERKNLLGAEAEVIDKLHEVRHICNFNGHEFAAEETINHNKVYFVIMQIKDLLNLTESTLVCT